MVDVIDLQPKKMTIYITGLVQDKAKSAKPRATNSLNINQSTDKLNKGNFTVLVDTNFTSVIYRLPYIIVRMLFYLIHLKHYSYCINIQGTEMYFKKICILHVL